MRQTFKDIGLQQQFEKLGYVIVDGIDANQAEQLKRNYNNLVGATGDAFESTMNNPSKEYKKAAFDSITEITQHITANYLNNYKPVTANFVIKRPHSNSFVPPHRDWSMCDESQYCGVNIWVALDHCNSLNGTLYILPGSHLNCDKIRGNKIPTNDAAEFLNAQSEFKPLYVKKGQAIIYDLRCLHYSPLNSSDNIRHAAGCACIPEESKPIHYIGNHEELISCYHATPEFYFNYSYGIDSIPSNSELIEQFKLPALNETSQSNIPKNTTTKSIFQDKNLEEQYNENGYVIIDYLGKPEISQLLQEFSKLTSWFQEGFMSSVYAPEMEYRKKMDEIITPFSHRLTDSILKNYRTVISTIMAKGSGEGSAMYPHQDWTLVDERRFASFNAWIPLVNVDYKNGALSILKGGHKLPFTLRGSNIPDALIDKSRFTPSMLTYLPMKAGQALIYDHRLVHVSPINSTSQVRPACVISLVPIEAEVFHYFYDKENNILKKYQADKTFYFDHVATQFSKPQQAVLIEEQSIDCFTSFTDEELAPILKQQIRRKPSLWQKIMDQ